MKVTERNYGYWTDYVEEGFGLTINSFTVDNSAGYCTSWELCSANKNWAGSTIDELYETLKEIKQLYKLDFHDSKNPYKDMLVIYTKNIYQAYGFLHNYGITDEFIKINKTEGVSDILYFQVLHNIEFRPCWYKKDEIEKWTAKDLQEYGTMMWELFIKDRYSYITSNQIIRKRTTKL